MYKFLSNYPSIMCVNVIFNNPCVTCVLIYTFYTCLMGEHYCKGLFKNFKTKEDSVCKDTGSSTCGLFFIEHVGMNIGKVGCNYAPSSSPTSLHIHQRISMQSCCMYVLLDR